MKRKQPYVIILTNSRLEEMLEAWEKLCEDLRKNGTDWELWLANDEVLFSWEEDLKKYFGIDFEPDWRTNPNSKYRQRLLEALNQNNVFIPRRVNGNITYQRARQGIDYDVTVASGLVDITPK